MEKNINKSVCFFDSGIGGLTLLYECVRKLPNVDFTYFADNYRVPYGALTHEELLKTVDEKFSEISKLKPAAAVIACNTVTAHCVEYLRNNYPFEIIGIQPAIKPAAAMGGKCLVLATPSTAESESLKSLVEKFGGGRTAVVPCPDLAYYIEQNIEKLSAEGVKSLLPDIKADSVVLGCTHYVFAKDIIKNHYNCPVFDGIEGTARNLAQKIGRNDHFDKRAQKITFFGGEVVKNRVVFSRLMMHGGLKWLDK